MKTFNHQRTTENNIHMLQRKYRGTGVYYIRGIFQGIEVGDEIISHTQFQGNSFMPLEVTEIISVADAKANLMSAEQKKNAHVELICKDNFFTKNNYSPYNNFGN